MCVVGESMSAGCVCVHVTVCGVLLIAAVMCV